MGAAPRRVGQLGGRPLEIGPPGRFPGHTPARGAKGAETGLIDEEDRDAFLLVQADEKLDELIDNERGEPSELVDRQQARPPP